MPLNRQTVINNVRTNRLREYQFTMPSDVPDGLYVGMLMAQSDLDDPAISFEYGLEYWWEPDQAWLLHASATFVGGPTQGKDGSPTPQQIMKANRLTNMRGLLCRAFVRPIRGACNVSVEVEGYER